MTIGAAERAAKDVLYWCNEDADCWESNSELGGEFMDKIPGVIDAHISPLIDVLEEICIPFHCELNANLLATKIQTFQRIAQQALSEIRTRLHE